MRVLLASREYPPETGWGGVGSYSHALAHALASAGCEVHVVSCVEGPERVCAAGGVTVHRAPLPARRWPEWRLRSRFPQVEERLLLARGVAAVARRLKPDVVEAPDWMAEGLLSGLRSRIPLVVHLHSPLDLVSSHRRTAPTHDTRLAGSLERLTVCRADAVTAADPEVLRWPNGRRWTHRHVTRIPPPMAADLVAGSAAGGPQAGHREATRPLVAMVGRLDELKAPEILIDALKLLKDKVPGLRAVLAGTANNDEAPGGGNYGSWIERTAKRGGLDVELTGQLPRKDVLELFRSARLVVVPSRYESFSMTALEAIACTTPVIVSSSCGIASWLSPLGSGWVVRPGDPAALALAMKPLLDDEASAHAAGVAGAALVMKEFAPATIARARKALYGSLF
jgi:glycogen synthase